MTATGICACTNDLNVEPLDSTVSTANRVYSDPANYERALFKIYSVWSLSGQDGAGGSDISELDAGNTGVDPKQYVHHPKPFIHIFSIQKSDKCEKSNKKPKIISKSPQKIRQGLITE